jgi:tetratricopeptide (TPR) repeat protein
LAVAESLDDPVLLADGLRQRGMVELFSDRHDDAERSISAALEAYDRADDAAGMAWARQNLAWISYVSGRMVEAEQRLSDAIVAMESIGDPAGIMWSRGLLAYVRIFAGRFAEAEELARRTLEESRERGDKWGQGMMNVALATVALWTGRVDEALQRTTQARSLFPADADPIGAVQATAIEGRALTIAGRVSEGMRLLQDGLEANSPGDSAYEMLRTSLAAAAASVGDVAAARRVMEELLTVDPDKLGESDRAVSAALTHLHMGEPDLALRLADLMPAPGAGAGSTWGFAVLALAATANGGDPAPMVAEVESSPRATYADRVLARCATACAAARAGDEAAARSGLERAGDAIPAGGDRLHPMIVAIASARCLETLGTADAGPASERAAKAAAALGTDGRGWGTVFATACGQVVAPAP